MITNQIRGKIIAAGDWQASIPRCTQQTRAPACPLKAMLPWCPKYPQGWMALVSACEKFMHQPPFWSLFMVVTYFSCGFGRFIGIWHVHLPNIQNIKMGHDWQQWHAYFVYLLYPAHAHEHIYRFTHNWCAYTCMSMWQIWHMNK